MNTPTKITPTKSMLIISNFWIFCCPLHWLFGVRLEY